MSRSEAKCGWCSSVFLAENKELNRGKGQFCCVSCANANRSANRRDPNARAKWITANINTPHYIAQRKAHHAVEEEIERGRMQRSPCEICGVTEHVHAHHDDYDKPLSVRWLCVGHHRELHG